MEDKPKDFKSKEIPSILFKRSIYDLSLLNISEPGQSRTVLEPITLKAYYDSKDQLVEVAIINSTAEIPKRVVRALSLCTPFHPSLTRLTIKRGGLTHVLIQEICRLLPHSNLTDVCLDDTFVPQGTYYILLQEASQIKYLSLNRCRISDAVCQKIAANLDFGCSAANSLRVLELVSNNITNLGAVCLGRMLRSNRGLLHLNLAGNKIGDEGGTAILSSLMEFRLTDDEQLEGKRRRFRYLENKQEIYKRCIVELLTKPSKAGTHTGSSGGASHRKSMISKRSHKSKKFFFAGEGDSNLHEMAEQLALGIVGEFVDPFCPECVVVRDGIKYSKGNLVLCSLNMAYNNLGNFSLEKLNNVIIQQQHLIKLPPETGLLRMILDGNPLPATCNELERIGSYFESINGHKATAPKKRPSSTSRKSRSGRSGSR
ncbi:uncharacterized protein LOC142982239 isoform X2 [Anticarsia gemmatalis]